MLTDNDIRTHGWPSLLGADEPAPLAVLNATSAVPVLLLCDHASRRFPHTLDDLGLAQPVRDSHLAIDIGAEAVTRKLAGSLAATAVLARYSRLVIDCNRAIDDPEAFLEFSDGMAIPGNHDLTAEQKQTRADSIYHPYHHAVQEQIQRLATRGTPPAIFAMHSFTPVFEGAPRPWEVGILWDGDERIAAPLLDFLRDAHVVVGDNKPYIGTGSRNYTLNRHARSNGLPNVAIEVRQDLIDHDAGVDQIATLLHDFIESMPAMAHSAAANTAPGTGCG